MYKDLTDSSPCLEECQKTHSLHPMRIEFISFDKGRFEGKYVKNKHFQTIEPKVLPNQSIK